MLDINHSWLRNLTSASLLRAVKLCEELHYCQESDSFPVHLHKLLDRMLGAVHFTVDRYGVDPFVLRESVIETVDPEMISVYTQYMHQHPLLSRIKNIRETEIGALHSEVPIAQFQKTGLYNEFYRLVDTADQLWISAICGDEMLVVCYSREKAFAKSEQAFMLLLKPHIEIAWRNWKKLCGLRSCLAHGTGKEALLEQGAAAVMGNLTRRQRQVAELVAQGLTNIQIGDALGCSPRTVGKHLENIYDLVNISSRAALAARWREYGGIQ